MQQLCVHDIKKKRMKTILELLPFLMRVCVSSSIYMQIRCYVITLYVHSRLLPTNIYTAMLGHQIECIYSWFQAVHMYQHNKNCCAWSSLEVFESCRLMKI